MLGRIRFVLIAAVLCLGGSPALGAVEEQLRTRVENSIAFLTETGDPDAIEAAKKLRNLLDDGKIVVGLPRDEADRTSGAWTENGVIFVNQATIGSPLPYNQITWEGSITNRLNWIYAFTIAQTLVHELVHVSQGQAYVNNAGGYLNWAATGGNQAEVEGWGVGLSSATRWLKLLEARLQGMPPSLRAEFARRLATAAAEIQASVEGSLTHLPYGNDFSVLNFQNPDGGVFLTHAEAMKYLLDCENRIVKLEAESLAELDKRREALATAEKPKCCLGDGDGPWFCCQWMHPVTKMTTCAPGKNRPLCSSYEQGKAVDNAACIAGACK